VVVVEEAYPLAFTCVLDPGWWSGEKQAGSWATVSPTCTDSSLHCEIVEGTEHTYGTGTGISHRM